MNDCIFCKIVQGTIPCTKIADTKNNFAFLDINPASKGHTLVIPKKHSRNARDLPEWQELMVIATRIGNTAMEHLGAEGFNLIMSNELAAGQEVFHAHMHVLPRYANDGIRLWPPKRRLVDAKEIAEKLRLH